MHDRLRHISKVHLKDIFMEGHAAEKKLQVVASSILSEMRHEKREIEWDRKDQFHEKNMLTEAPKSDEEKTDWELIKKSMKVRAAPLVHPSPSVVLQHLSHALPATSRVSRRVASRHVASRRVRIRIASICIANRAPHLSCVHSLICIISCMSRPPTTACRSRPPPRTSRPSCAIRRSSDRTAKQWHSGRSSQTD